MPLSDAAVRNAKARERCGEARKHLANGVDPSVMEQVGKAATEDSFEAVARMARQIFAGLGCTPCR